MAKKTYQEMVDAGWTARWGVYDDQDGTWLVGDDDWSGAPEPGTRTNLEQWSFRGPPDQTRPRRYWSRKKVKPAEKTFGQIACVAYFDYDGNAVQSMDAAAYAILKEVARRLGADGHVSAKSCIERMMRAE